MSTTVLCGGVGAARFLRGLMEIVDPTSVTAIVNVGDDTELHGLHISPDIDTVTYTLADAIDPDRGWGLAGETWNAMGLLDRYGNPTWFNLGDQDLATHIVRTERLRRGEPLSSVTAHLAASWGLTCGVIPVTDDPLRTMVTVEGTQIGFQEYFVGRQHDVAIEAVRFDRVETTTPAPGVLDAIASAERVVIAPSNPVVSIDPLLAVPGVREAVAARRDAVAAISPIVSGAALKGPAARMLDELGEEASAVGVAERYAALAGTLVIDEADADRRSEVEATGVRCVVTDTIMRDVERASALAKVAVA
ncbi:MAG: 2-phospho-L-lactate transferase [Acidimicrobiales bacterium]|nr:2-phospho-L-lactate transferase [Acidimicrobiales bacterium]